MEDLILREKKKKGFSHWSSDSMTESSQLITHESCVCPIRHLA